MMNNSETNKQNLIDEINRRVDEEQFKNFVKTKQTVS